jgi:chromosome segregation ATPase
VLIKGIADKERPAETTQESVDDRIQKAIEAALSPMQEKLKKMEEVVTNLTAENKKLQKEARELKGQLTTERAGKEKLRKELKALKDEKLKDDTQKEGDKTLSRQRGKHKAPEPSPESTTRPAAKNPRPTVTATRRSAPGAKPKDLAEKPETSQMDTTGSTKSQSSQVKPNRK